MNFNQAHHEEASPSHPDENSGVQEVALQRPALLQSPVSGGSTLDHGTIFESPVTAKNDEERPEAQPLQGIPLRGNEERTPAIFDQSLGGIQEIRGVNYHTGFKTSNFRETSGVEQNPVNGFNYRSQSEVSSEAPESHQQYSIDGLNDNRHNHHNYNHQQFKNNEDETPVTEQSFQYRDQTTDFPNVNQNYNSFQIPEDVLRNQQPPEHFNVYEAVTTRPENVHEVFPVITESPEIPEEVKIILPDIGFLFVFLVQLLV